MAAPMPWSHARVAIIGGGVAGLCTALGLVRAGVRCVVFDTGEHGTGGRLATRAAADGSLRPAWLPRDTPSDLDAGAGLVFDHAAQYFTASDPEFVALVEEWRKAGVVRQWDGPVGVLDAQAAPGADRFTATPLGPKGRWVTAGGMRALAAHMTRTLQEGFPDLFELRAPVWVSRMELQYATPAGATAATPTGATPAAATLAAATTKAAVAVGGAAAWKLLGRGGKSEGSFDAVVIAHNGKCANRLVSPAGAPLVAKQLMALRLSAVWSLMVAFDGPLPFDQSASCAPFQGATVSGCAALGWVADNSAKLRLEHARPGLSCWTLQSTDAYAQANKVPQEQVPPDVQAKVTDDLLSAFASALGVPREALPPVVYSRAQLWGAAVPLNSPQVPCILDPLARVAVAGDWVAGRNVQAGALSGLATARALAALRGVAPRDAAALGLRTPLVKLA